MDINLYRKETERLANETNSLSTADTDSVSSSSSKGTSIWKYKNYIFISLGALLVLYLVKPKIVLKIEMKDDTPCMVVDTGKFVIAWVGLTAVLSLMLFVFLKFRRSS